MSFGTTKCDSALQSRTDSSRRLRFSPNGSNSMTIRSTSESSRWSPRARDPKQDYQVGINFVDDRLDHLVEE